MSAQSIKIRMKQHLKPRHQQVLGLLAGGLMPKEIAAKIGVADCTVEYHMGTLKRDTGLDSYQQLTKLAYRLGLTKIDV